MAGLLQNLLWSALDATLLALIVATVARLAKLRAPVRHVLWLMVLLKLLVPPVAVHSFGLSGICTSTVEQLHGYAAQWPQQPLVVAADRVNSPDSLAVGHESQAADVGDEMVSRLETYPTASTLGDEPLSDSLSQSQDAIEATLADVPTVAESFQAVEAPSIWQTESPADDSAISQGSFDDLRETSSIDVAPVVPTATGAMAFWIWLTGSGLERGLMWFWLAGSFGLLAVRTRQCVGLLRLVRRARSAPASVVAACREVAGRFDLAGAPAVRMVERSLSPTVCVLHRTTILLPAELVNRCGNHVVRSVLAHELAHVKRRDHWLCWIELLGSCVYWWHPVFWWARHEMRRAADEAADAWAVSVLGCRKQYAESLLQTVELLVADRAVAAAWCPALGQRDTIARRMTMIMKEPLSRRLSWPAWLGVAVVGLLVLPAAPLRSSAQDPVKPSPNVPSDDEIAAAVEAFDATTPQRPREPRPGESRSREQDQLNQELFGARPLREPQPVQPGGADRRPDGQRRPESGPHDAQRPQPPGAPGRGDGPRDPERRLQELEAKLDRIMQMLESRPGQPGVAATPGGPGRGTPGGPGGGMISGGPGGGLPGGPPGGMPGPGGGMPRGGMPGARFGAGRPGAGPDGVENMLRGIELKPEQRERIEHAMKDVQAEIQKVEAEQARAVQEFQHRRMELERRRAEIVRDVLSPEQRERLGQRGPDGERPRQRGSEGRGEPRGVGRGDGSGTGRGDGRGEGRDERRVEGRGGPDRPREGTEPRRERGPDQPPDGARGRGGPGPDRPRETTEPRRGPEGERPRDGGEPPRRRESERPEEEAGFNAESFGFFVGLIR